MRNPLRAYLERLVRAELVRYTEIVADEVNENNKKITEQLIEIGLVERVDGGLRKADVSGS